MFKTPVKTQSPFNIKIQLSLLNFSVVTTGKEACLAVVEVKARGSPPDRRFNRLKWNRMNKDLCVAFTVQVRKKKVTE